MNKENQVLDVLGIGLGPFNLSLAALLDSVQGLDFKFCESKANFSWHPELMFKDAHMQTTYLKDLVTAVDPTSPYTFLNYLVQHGMLYHFINTDRQVITRLEFQEYCRWVSRKLSEKISFNTPVTDVEYRSGHFVVSSAETQFKTKNICLATGPVPNIPDCAKAFISESLFHAKSQYLKDCSMRDKKVLIVGGGQSGLEVFRNSLHGLWGKPQHVKLITARQNLVPLDEGPFTNEVFTPNFVSQFHSLEQSRKDEFTKNLLFASDGNTPDYLQDFYNELYLDRFYHQRFCDYEISPMRWLKDISKTQDGYSATIQNLLTTQDQEEKFDLVVLATGFKTQLPKFLDSIKDQLHFDSQNRPIMSKNYEIESDFKENKIFAMNYSRHGHGIADPQTSLMSWRSAVIANSLLGKGHFREDLPHKSFLNFF